MLSGAGGGVETSLGERWCTVGRLRRDFSASLEMTTPTSALSEGCEVARSSARLRRNDGGQGAHKGCPYIGQGCGAVREPPLRGTVTEAAR